MREKITLWRSGPGWALKNAMRVSLVVFVLIGSSLPLYAQLELLKDVELSENATHNEYSSLTHAGNYMYYVSNNELWKSNGTTQYTVRMRGFTSISDLTMAGNTLFFTADDGIAGAELWKSNGSPASTVRVKDIVPGPEGSTPAYLTNVNGTLFFAAYSTGKGIELWKSNGTSSGTVIVKDISRGSASPKNLANFNGTLYFSATSPTGFELWKSDGTADNTVLVKDINIGTKSSNPESLTVSNNRLFFVALHPSAGRELWVTDGTTEGTQLLKDIRPGTQTSTPERLLHANGKLMFTANDGIHGDELWASDGTSGGTVLVKDMNPGPAGSNTTDPRRSLVGMDHFANINGLLYFIASKGDRDFIYRSDGTEAGTVVVIETHDISMNGPDPEFTYRNGYVYFFHSGSDDNYEYGLYRMPYKGGSISLIAVLGNTPNWEASRDAPLDNQMMFFNGNVYFFARFYVDGQGIEFIRTDGTPEGTVSVHDTFIPTADSNPGAMITVNGITYMLHFSFLSYEPPLYRTDGTPEGTYELRPERYQHEWEALGNDLYFVEQDYADNIYVWQLYKTQGTPETTIVVKRGDGRDEDRPKGLTPVGGVMYFFNDLGELWKTDGTSQGTVMIDDVYLIHSITDVRGVAFIIGENEMGGLEVWKETSSGLTLLKSFPEGTAGRFDAIDPTAVVGQLFYFLANDGVHGYEVWRSDGTTAGTTMQFGPDGIPANWSYPNVPKFISFNNVLYISAIDENGDWGMYYASGSNYVRFNDDVDQVNVWFETEDKLYLSSQSGANRRTVYAMDKSHVAVLLTSFPPYSGIHFTTVGDYVYFNTASSRALWRTDGTPCGTGIVDVGAESPYAMEGLGNDLIFGGYVLATGHEPYVYHNVNSIPGPTCAVDAMLATSTNENKNAEEILTPYPNPFTESFSMMVKGSTGEIAEVAVFSGTGMPIEKLENIGANIEYHNIGTTWQKGFYIVKVRTAAKLQTYHIIKK